MAEEERKTKAERRAEARAERKRREQEEARQQKRASIRNWVITTLVIAVIAAVSIPAIINLVGGNEAEATTLDPEAAQQARADAGCEMVVNNQPLSARDHFTAGSAPSADTLYANSPVRPTTSGSHYGQPAPALGGIPSSPLDERATTHNLEHGSVIVWYNPDGVDDATTNNMEQWMLSRQRMGFEGRSGGNVFVSPYDNMTGDKPIAIRAWGFALNCDSWDSTVGDSMVIDYWGTHGFAPERSLSPYPSNAIDYTPQSSETPSDSRSASSDASSSPSAPAASEPAASESADPAEVTPTASTSAG